MILLWIVDSEVKENDFNEEFLCFLKRNKTFNLVFNIDLGCYELINPHNINDKVTTFGCLKKTWSEGYTVLEITDLHNKSITFKQYNVSTNPILWG